MEEVWLCTLTVVDAAAGFSVTETSRTVATATETSDWAGANPGALTVMWYAPGSRSSRRNSPRSSLEVSRSSDEVADSSTIFAEAMRAPVASCTVPRREPRGFCACRTVASKTIDTTPGNDFPYKSFPSFETKIMGTPRLTPRIFTAKAKRIRRRGYRDERAYYQTW